MDYWDTFEQALLLARDCLARMQELHVAAHPHNYEVWFNYVAARDLELVRLLDLALTGAQPLTEAFCQDVYRRFFGRQSDREAIDDAGERLTAELGSVVGHLQEAGRDTRGYRATLERVAPGLASDEAPRLIEAAIAATRRMEARTQLLEQTLARSLGEVAALKSNLEQALRDASTDALTRLANRSHFDRRLLTATVEAMSSGEALSLVLADIDHFKACNDRWGHLVGDQVLRLVGRVLRDNVKGRDLAARFGGEEFALILPETGLAGAAALAERVRTTVGDRTLVLVDQANKRFNRITMSFGVACYVPGEAPESLIGRADRALYAAKTAGRDRVVREDELPG